MEEIYCPADTDAEQRGNRPQCAWSARETLHFQQYVQHFCCHSGEEWGEKSQCQDQMEAIVAK